MIIDAHTHAFPDKVAQAAVDALAEAYGAVPVMLPTIDNLLRHMDEAGVDKSIVCPVATRPEQVRSINRWIQDLPKDRLIPFGALHPHYDDNETQMQRLIDAGIRGIKFQPYFQDFRLAEPQTDRLLEMIGDQFLLIMHAGDEIAPIPHVEPTPQRLAALINRHPYSRLSIAHMGGYQLWDDAEEHLVGRNVYLDTCYAVGIAPDEQMRRMIETHGPDRILWGSDFPWDAQASAMGNLRRLGLPSDQERAIMGENFLRALEGPADG
jgi:predicted TIM-barrel fold metal-dependent hydrolase